MRRLVLVTLACLALAVPVVPGAPGSVEAPGASGASPRILYLDTDAGPRRGGPGGLGVPVGVYGTGFGRDPARLRVTIGGVPVARVVSLDHRRFGARLLDVAVVQPGARIVGGPVVVTVAGRSSAPGERFTPTGGRVRLVRAGAADAGDCAFARPCGSLTAAIGVARPGDAILVADGDVADDEVWVRSGAGGTAGHPLVIRALPGTRPTFRLHGRPVILEGSHVRFIGFAFTGGKALVVGAETSSDIRVVDNTFAGAIDYAAIGTHGDDLLVAGNRCSVAGSSQGTEGHCFYVSRGRHVRLLDNRAEGAPGYGIHVFDQQRAADDPRREILDVLIEGNLLVGSTERSGLILAMGDEGKRGNRIDGVTVRGNVFTANDLAGIAIGPLVSDVTIERNTFVANGRQAITVYDGATISGISIRGNLIDERPNRSCRANCDWYRLAHVEIGRRARSVTVDGNWYVPARPTVLGGRDPHSSGGAVRYRDPAGDDLGVVSPKAATAYAAPT